MPQIWNQSRLGAGARLASPGAGGQKACDSQFVTDAPFQSPAAATVLADAGARTTSQGRGADPLVSGNCGHGEVTRPLLAETSYVDINITACMLSRWLC